MRQEWVTAQTNLAQAHATFQHAAAAIALRHRDQAGGCGSWSPKQVAAHLAGWDREAARALRALVAGAPEDFVIGIDAFNQASVDARAHLSWDSTCLDLRQAHASLQQAIGAIIIAQVSARGYLAWMNGRLADYELHTAQLRAWVLPEAEGQRMPMTVQQTREILLAYAQASHTPAAATFFADTITSTLLNTGRETRGRAAVAHYIAELQASARELNPKRAIVGEGQAAVEIDFVTRDGATIPYSIIYEFDAGKIAAIRFYFAGKAPA